MSCAALGATVAVSLACAPERTQQDRVLRPVVSETSVVTQPDASETSVVVVTRLEGYVGEAMGFSPAESSCVVAAMVQADMKESWFFDPPTEEVHEQVLRFMQQCLADPGTYTAPTDQTTTPPLPTAGP